MPGNMERNIVTATVEGTTYSFQMTINAMCEVEAMVSTPTLRVSFRSFVIDQLSKGRYIESRLFLWCALRAHHPEMTVEKTGWLMDRIGWNESTTFVQALMDGVQPDAADLKVLGLETPVPDPRDARPVGTGGRSESKREKSASKTIDSGGSPSANSSASL